jgi:hypothetical protein
MAVIKRKPKRGDVLIYRWGSTGKPTLCVVMSMVKAGAFLGFNTPMGSMASATPIKFGTLKDGKTARGTVRWPRDGELVKRRGKWSFAK